jgi:membrane protein
MPIVQRLRAAVEPVLRATVNFHRDGCFDRATVIAYFALLSFLPLAVFLVTMAALALGPEAAEKGTEVFFQNLLYRMPPQLMTQVRSLQSHLWSGVGYLILVLYTASKVFSKIESGLDHVFRVDERRPFARRKLFAFALVGLMSVVLVATVVMEGLMGTVDRFVDTTALAPLKTMPFYLTLDSFVTRTIAPWSLTMFSFFVVYWLLPAETIPWRVALVGGAVAGTLWNILKVGFTYYISHLASYTRTYGALATVIVFLLWMNLSASILLWGGELAAVVGGFRSGDHER